MSIPTPTPNPTPNPNVKARTTTTTTTKKTLTKVPPQPKGGLIGKIESATGQPAAIIFAVLGLIMVLIVGSIIAVLMGNSNKEQIAAQEQAARAASQAASTPMPASAVGAQGGKPAYFFQVDDTHWAKQPIPLEALVTKITIDLNNQANQVSGGKGLITPRGEVIAPGTPDYNRIMQSVGVRLNSDIGRNVQARMSTDGTYTLYTLNPQTSQFEVVDDVATLNAIEQQAQQSAQTALQSELTNYIPPVQPQQAQAQQQPTPIPDSVITQAEKSRYLRLIELQRQENQDIRRENIELSKKLGEQQKSVTTIIQKLEDVPEVNRKLRATMLPKSTGMSVQAVVGDRVWLKNKQGDLITLSIGEAVPDTNLRIADVQEDTNLVMVTPK